MDRAIYIYYLLQPGATHSEVAEQTYQVLKNLTSLNDFRSEATTLHSKLLTHNLDAFHLLTPWIDAEGIA